MSQQKDLVTSLLNNLLSQVNIADILASLPTQLQTLLGSLLGGKRSLNVQSLLSVVQTVLSLLPSNISSIFQQIIGAALNNRSFDVQVLLASLGPLIQNVPQSVISAVLGAIQNPSSILQVLPTIFPEYASLVQGLFNNPQAAIALALSLLPPNVASIISTFLGQHRGLDLSGVLSGLFELVVSQFPPQIISIVQAILGASLNKSGFELSSILASLGPLVQQQINQLFSQLPQSVVSFVSSLFPSFGNRAFDLSSVLPLVQSTLLGLVPVDILQQITGVINEFNTGGPLAAGLHLLNLALNNPVFASALSQLQSVASALPDVIQQAIQHVLDIVSNIHHVIG